ncbi:MAG: D-glutamate deacylase, partial [Spirochaetota bacterium]
MPEFELVIRGGRVIDPASGVDAVMDLAVKAGKIAALSTSTLVGRRVVDASGLVVAPGFIDIHSH